MKSKHKKQVLQLSQKLFVVLLACLIALYITHLFSHRALTLPPPQSDTPPVLYAHETYHDLRNVFSGAIQNAKQSILLIIYSLSDPIIINNLINKAEEGIDVVVICDAKACPGIRSRLGPGIQVHKRIGKGLMHQKILLVDDEYIWIGSANMTNESLQLHGNLVTAFHCPAMGTAIKEKASYLVRQKNETVPHQLFNINGQPTELSFFPDDTQGVQRLIKLIQSAEKTIKVAMFTWTRPDLVQALDQAKKRGVQVEVVIDYHAGKGSSAKVAKLLKEKGIPIRLGQGNGLLHHKFAYIDGKTLVNGSANWTKAAFTKNDDCYIILHDLSPSQNEFLNNLWTAIVAESEPLKD